MSTEEKVEKFNKPEQYKFLSETVLEKVSFASENDKAIYLEMIKEKFEPKKGGGQTANPPQEIDGVMHYYCRLKQEYRPIDEMQMSKGEPKGVTSLASKHEYRLKSEVTKLEKEAVTEFMKGTPEGITKGQSLKAQADVITASLTLAETYADENLEYLKDKTETKIEEVGE